MPRRGKRAAASKKNGALGGRSSGSAEGHPAADAPQGVAALVAPSKKPVGRPKNKPSAEPLVRRDPDRICLDDGRAFLAGDFPGNPERERRESSCQGKGRSSGAKGSRGDPFSLLFAALICLLLSQKSIAEPQRNKSLCFSTQYCLKRNTRAAATTAGEQGEAATPAPAKEGGKRENKAAGAHAAACVLVLTAEAGIFFACGEH